MTSKLSLVSRSLLCGALAGALLESVPTWATTDTEREPFVLSFRRADANADGSVNVSDASRTFSWLFLGGEVPDCLDAVDSNDDGRADLADGIYTLNALFRGGPGVPSPGTESCGRDPTSDGLGCDNYGPCICGGIGGLACKGDQLCDLAPGFCDGVTDVLGSCVPFPEACTEIYDPVCGCDGVTYPNDCHRLQARVPLDRSGPCGDNVAFRSLGRATASGASVQTRILRDSVSWETFWNEHAAIFIPPPELPAVDFTCEMVVVVVEFFTSGGYHLQIDEVRTNQDRVGIFLTRVVPTEDCGTTDAETQPYHFVATARVPGDLEPTITVLPACCDQGMQASGTGDCEQFFGYAWDAGGCQQISGCDCEGRDCDDLFRDVDECLAAYNGCPLRIPQEE